MTYLEINEKWINYLVENGLFNYQFLRSSAERGYVIELTKKSRGKVQYTIVDLELVDIQIEAQKYKWLSDFAKQNELLYRIADKKNLLDKLKNMYGEPLVKKPWYVI